MQVKTTADAWLALEKALEDKGLHRRLRLLRSLYSIELINFNTMDFRFRKNQIVTKQEAAELSAFFW